MTVKQAGPETVGEPDPECRAEFTVEPFEPGEPGPHVLAAIGAAQLQGLNVEVGPFGNVLRGPTDHVLRALDAAIRAALTVGATRVSTQIDRIDPTNQTNQANQTDR